MLSVPPIDRLWHELHEMNPDFDSLGSKYSFLPSSAMPRSISLGGVIGCTSAQSSLVPCASAAVVVAAVSAAPMTEIGRASCRERAEMAVVAVALEEETVVC